MVASSARERFKLKVGESHSTEFNTTLIKKRVGGKIQLGRLLVIKSEVQRHLR